MKPGVAFLIAFGSLAACSAAQGPLPHSLAGITVSDGPRLSARRATHAMVRISDGRILALGGCVEDGCDSGPASATVDIISADGRRLERTGQLLARRVQPAAIALPGGNVLVIGGWVDGRVADTTEIFNVANGRSRAGPRLAGPRAAPTVVPLADGRVLIAGGYDGQSVQANAQIFDPRTSRLSAVGSLGIARSAASGTLLPDGKVLIVGGGDGESDGRRALASAELFDPTSGRFNVTGSLGQRRYKHGAVALPGGDVLIVGGSDERDYRGKLRSVERYDTEMAKFVAAGSLAIARFKLADGILLLDRERVLVAAGGLHPEVFNVATGKGELLSADLGSQWNYMTLARLDGSTAMLVGGYREGVIQPTDQTWRFALK